MATTMPKGTNATTEWVGAWRDRLSKARTFKKDNSDEDQWDKYRDWYRSKFEDDSPSLNLIYSNGKSIVPAVYFRNPKVTIIARNPKGYYAAKILEKIVNWLIAITDVKRHLKRMVLDTYLYGTGTGIFGYDSEFGFDIDLGEGTEFVEGTKKDRVDVIKVEYAQGSLSGFPFFMRVDPRNILVPDGSIYGDTIRWFARTYYRPREDVRKDEKYDHRNLVKQTDAGVGNTGPPNVTSPDLATQGENAREGIIEKTDENILTLTEVHDQRTRRWFVLLDGENQQPLKEPVQDVLQTPNLPIQFLCWNEDGGPLWAKSDVAHVEDQQKEVNDITAQLQEHRLIHNLFMILKGGAFDEETVKRIEEGEVGRLLFTKSGEEDLSNTFALVNPPYPVDLFPIREQVMRDVGQTLGMSRNEAGEESGSSRRTKFEIQRMASGSGRRLGERRDMVGDILVRIAQTYASLVMTLWTGERFAQIVGPEGEPTWASYTGKDLAGSYDFEVNPEDAAVLDAGDRTQIGFTLLERIAPFMGVTREDGKPMVNLEALIEEALIHIPGIDVNRIMNRMNPQQAMNAPTMSLKDLNATL